MITIEEVRQYYDWYKHAKALDECPVDFAKSCLAELAISQHEEIERLKTDNKDALALLNDLKEVLEKVRSQRDRTFDLLVLLKSGEPK